jgi:hypothetical protein
MFSRYDPATMRCALCKTDLAYVHGHAACVRSGCPMFGVNQAECCSGETAETGPLTAEVAGIEVRSNDATPNSAKIGTEPAPTSPAREQVPSSALF